MKNRLLAATAISGLAFFAATPAFATCDIHHPTNGDTITCSTAGGTDLLGVEDGVDNIIVNVDAGAGVHPSVGGDDAITIGSGTVNLGAGSNIQSSSSVAIHGTDGTGGVVSVIDSGGSTITGGTFGILLESGGSVAIGSGTTVSGGTAIKVANTNSATASDVWLYNTSIITGNVSAGANASDSLHWVQEIAGNFATADIGSKYLNFENFYKDGSATTTLTGTNAVDWNIAAGTLVANYNAISNVTGTGGTFQINNTSGLTQTYSGNITGDINVIANNGSQLTLNGANTFTGSLTLQNGLLIIHDNAAASATSGITINNTALAFGSADTYTANIALASGLSTLNAIGYDITLSGNITGGAGHDANINGGSVYTLTGTNSFGDLILTSASTIKGAGASLGNASSSFSGSGTVQITGGTVVSSINGSNKVKLDNATATLSGTNAFTGALTLTNAAGLTVNSAAAFSGTSGVSLSGASNFGFGTAMTTDRNFSIGAGGAGIFTNGHNDTISGVLSGSGTLTKLSTGTLTISNNANTYSGIFNVQAGRVDVNGSLANAAVMQLSGSGTLGGTGTVGSINALTGSTVNPGVTIGTLTTTGGVSFNNGSHYAVDYNPTSSDLLDVTGGVSIISSTLDLTGAGGTYSATHDYTIIHTTTGITGTFSTINNNLAFLDATQNIVGNDLILTMARNDTSFSDVAENDPQKEVADAITELGAGNPIYDEFTGLTADQAQDAMTAIASNPTQPAQNSILTVLDRLASLSMSHISGPQIASAQADPSVYTSAYMEPSSTVNRNMGAWMEAIGGFGSTDADHAANTGKSTSGHYGLVGGLDLASDGAFQYGINAGYANSQVSQPDQGASSETGSYMLGAYTSGPVMGDYILTGGATLAYNDVSSVRHVTVGATSYSPHGDTDGWAGNAYARLMRPLKTRNDITVAPYAMASLYYSHINGYTETGGGAANLTVDDSNTLNPIATLGSQFGKSFKTPGGRTVNLNADLGWQHTFGDVDGQVDERFATGTVGFDAYSPRSRDAAVVGLSADTNIHGMNAYVSYNGTLSGDAQEHGFKAGVKWDF